MNNNCLFSTTTNNDFSNRILSEAYQLISDAALNSQKESHEKYELKNKIIEEAKDMTTQEKINAIDNNYDRRNQENWHNILNFTVFSFGVISIILGSPIAIKNIRKLIVS